MNQISKLPIAVLAIALVGCGHGGTEMSKDEMDRLLKPTREIPPEAAAAMAKGMSEGMESRRRLTRLPESTITAFRSIARNGTPLLLPSRTEQHLYPDCPASARIIHASRSAPAGFALSDVGWAPRPPNGRNVVTNLRPCRTRIGVSS